MRTIKEIRFDDAFSNKMNREDIIDYIKYGVMMIPIALMWFLATWYYNMRI